jgi:hypothetical protein
MLEVATLGKLYYFIEKPGILLSFGMFTSVLFSIILKQVWQWIRLINEPKIPPITHSVYSLKRHKNQQIHEKGPNLKHTLRC